MVKPNADTSIVSLSLVMLNLFVSLAILIVATVTSLLFLMRILPVPALIFSLKSSTKSEVSSKITLACVVRVGACPSTEEGC